MTRSPAFVLWTCALALTISCAHPNSYKKEGERVTLRFIDSSNVDELKIDGSLKQGIRDACSSEVSVTDPTKVRATRAGGGLVAGGIAAVIGFGIDLAVKALEKEEQKYSASFTGRASTSFYRRRAGTDELLLRHPCFQLTRYAKVDGKDELASEFLAQFVLSESSDAFRIKPLRSRQPYAKAKVGSEGKLSLNMSVALDAVWQAKSKVFSSRIGDVNLVAMNVKLPEKGTPTTPVYAHKNWFDSQWFPAPPLSTDANGVAYGLGSLTLTVSVQQDGKSVGKDILGKTSSVLESKKDDITGAVKDAIDDALDG